MRKMTWVLWAWTAIFAVWIIAGIADRASKNCPPDDQLCINASDAGTSIGVGLVFFLWFIGFVVLSLIWFMTRPQRRACPVCGEDVKKGLTRCGSCGHDFAASAPTSAVESSITTETVATPGQAAAAVPAGWYQDPTDPSLLRYWTGSAWTTQIARAGE
jgi:hypothetical protein